MGLFSKKSPQEKLDRKLFFGFWSHADAIEAALKDGANPNCTQKKEFVQKFGHSEFKCEEQVSALFYNLTTSRYLYQKINCLDALLSAGANPDFATPEKGVTALMWACSSDEVQIVEKLLEGNANPNLADHNGNTALHYVLKNQKIDINAISKMTQLLIAHGANVDIRNAAMQTPTDLALERNYTVKIAEYLTNKLPDMQVPAAQKTPEAGSTGWHMTDANEICLISEKSAIGYRLTEIFNFEKRTYVEITQNLKTKAESQAMKQFDDIADIAFVEKARDELVARGGNPGEIRPQLKIIKSVQ